MEKLRDVLPREFFQEYMDTPAAKLLDVVVVAKHDSRQRRWPGVHKNVFIWWELENGKAVGWNENPAIGWSFPVARIKQQEISEISSEKG